VFAVFVIECCPMAAATSTNVVPFTPSNPPAMQPITSHDSPAWRASRMFQHGVNLGDYLEAPPENFGRGVTVSAAEMTQMKREGFDHVRVPVGWHHFAGAAPAFTLAPVIFSRAETIAGCAKRAGR